MAHHADHPLEILLNMTGNYYKAFEVFSLYKNESTVFKNSDKTLKVANTVYSLNILFFKKCFFDFYFKKICFSL